MSKRIPNALLAALSILSGLAFADDVIPRDVTEASFGEGCVDGAAVCDGAHFDACALQNAINWAVANSGELLIPSGTCVLATSLGAQGLIVPANSAIRIEGVSRDGSFLMFWSTTPDATALTVGSLLTDSPTGNFSLNNVTIDTSGSPAPGVNGLVLNQLGSGVISNVVIIGSLLGPSFSSGTGLSILGASLGNYTVDVLLNNVSVKGNFAVGIQSGGSSTGNFSNGHVFSNVTIYRANKHVNGTVGFLWGAGSGDGWITSADVEGYDVGYQIDGANLKGEVRAEQNTTALAFGANSYFNRIVMTPFDNCPGPQFPPYLPCAVPQSVYTPRGFRNQLIQASDMIVNNSPGGSLGGTTMLSNTGDGALSLLLQAGVTTQQPLTFGMVNYATGNFIGRFWSEASHDLHIDDGIYSKIAIHPGSSGETQIDSPFKIGSFGTPITGSFRASTTLPGATTIPANSCLDLGVDVAGCAVNAECFVSTPPSGPGTNINSSCYVSAADRAQIRFCNSGTSNQTGTSGTYSVRCWNP